MKPKFAVRSAPCTVRTAPAARERARIPAVAVTALLAVLLLHGAARAQQSDPEQAPPSPPPPAPADAPPAPPTAPGDPPAAPAPPPPLQPPPNYPKPPPGYPPPPPYGGPPGGAPAPHGYYPRSYFPQPPRPQYRPFTLGMGLGVGALAFHDEFGERQGEPGLSYTLRVGFGITRSWLIFLGAEGTGVTHDDAGVWHTAYLLGAQCFVIDRVYARGGLGLSTATIQDDSVTGQALMAAAGFEFAQGYSTSLAVELSFTGARYPGETWSNGGLNFVLSFF